MVPDALKQPLLRENHDSSLGGHLGVHKTMSKLKRQYYWRGMSHDVRTFIKSCPACVDKQPSIAAKPGLKASPIEPYRPFVEVNADVVGPLPRTDRGNQFIFVITDKVTRWVEAYALPSVTAAALASVFVKEFISRYGCPIRFTTDQGSNFTSELFAEVNRILGVHLRHSHPYAPWTNGAVERTNGTLQQMLTASANERRSDWDDLLPLTLFAYRTATCRATGFSPFQMVFGSEPRMPSEASLKASPPPSDARSGDAAQFVSTLSRDLHEVWSRAREADRGYRSRQNQIGQVPGQETCPGSDIAELRAGDRAWLCLPNSAGGASGSGKLRQGSKNAATVVSPLGSNRVLVETHKGRRVEAHAANLRRLEPLRIEGGQSSPHSEPVRRMKRPRMSYDVEKILAQRKDRHGQDEYLVQWAGYGHEDNTWEPRASFTLPGHVNTALLAWEQAHKTHSASQEHE